MEEYTIEEKAEMNFEMFEQVCKKAGFSIKKREEDIYQVFDENDVILSAFRKTIKANFI
jgi:hypothetical protein